MSDLPPSDTDGPEAAQVEDVRSKTWFDHMDGYLVWKIIGPDITNPFKSPLPFPMLHRMANQREYLNQFIQIRCMCDGYEVMVISNPNAPRISTSHPTLSRMERHDVVDYIRRASLDEYFDAEIDRIQEEIRLYLRQREKTLDKDDTTFLAKKQQGKAPEQKKKDESASKMAFRIVKR
jgi:hypothetical protein